MDRKDYETEVYRPLNGESAYLKLQQDPKKAYSNLLKVTVREGLALDYINKDLSDFLVNEYPRILLFYTWPKIHKPGFPPVG